MTLRSHLLILVAAAVFPVLAFAGYVVLTLWQEQRAAHAESALGNVRALAIAVDSETDGYVRALQGLVAESDPDSETSARFVVAARRELATQPTWNSIAMADATGKVAVEYAAYKEGSSEPFKKWAAAEIDPARQGIPDRVPLNDFEPGKYKIEIKLTDKGSNKTLTESLPFTVSGS